MPIFGPDTATMESPTGTAPETDETGRMQGVAATNTDEVQPDPAATDLDGLLGQGQGISFADALSSLDAPDAVTETSPDPDEAGTDEGGPNAGASEEGILSPEDDASDAGASDAGAEADPDADEGDTDPDETTAAAEEAGEGAVDAFLESVNKEFEDVRAESPDDVLEELRRERASNDVIVETLDAHPALVGFFEDVIRARNETEGAVDVSTLAREHFNGYEMPDPAEDPEGYRKAVEAQARREAMREAQAGQHEQQMSQVQQDLDTMRETAQQSLKKAAKTHDLEGEALNSFQQRLAEFVSSPSEDFATVVYREMHHDDLIEQAKEEAYTKGKNDATQERRRRRKKGNEVARLSSSQTNTTSRDDDGEEDLVSFASSLQRTSDPLADLAGM